MSYFSTIRREADPIWNAIFEHPFVRGIGDASLPLDVFRYYIGQDYKYIVRYAQVRALAVVKSRDPAMMAVFADGVKFILSGEALFHRYASDYLQVPMVELSRGEMAPTARAYTDFIARVGHEGTLAEIIAAMLPCLYGYCEIGRRLNASRPGHPLFDRWIETYAGDEMWKRACWNADALDRLAADSSDEQRELIRDHFLTGSRYEWMFFDMALKREQWPI